MSPGTQSGADSVSGTLTTSPLIDNHGRPLTYLRLAITDRCNLRCIYCMPASGVALLSHEETLRYEELERLVRLFFSLGLKKVRITGGEPLVRRGCLNFLQRLKENVRIAKLYMTTNGVAVAEHLDRLKDLPISGINLSLDTPDRARFRQMTRRDRLEEVLRTLHGALARSIPLKINSVVTAATRDDELVALANLAHEHGIMVRFIEQMPFFGERAASVAEPDRLIERFSRLFPDLSERVTDSASTARSFQRPGFRGTLGIIEGRSRKFCTTCNKLRITPQGMLKTCLYDDGVLDLRRLLRSGVGDDEIRAAVVQCVMRRYANGHETEITAMRTCQPSMAEIGG